MTLQHAEEAMEVIRTLEKHAIDIGAEFHPTKDFLKLRLHDIIDKNRKCPCHKSRKCPCKESNDELEERGRCKCTMFVSVAYAVYVGHDGGILSNMIPADVIMEVLQHFMEVEDD